MFLIPGNIVATINRVSYALGLGKNLTMKHGFLFKLNIRNYIYTLIDFLRLPRPQGERRTEASFAGELGAAKINLLLLGLG
jgi:hypothetical protein